MMIKRSILLLLLNALCFGIVKAESTEYPELLVSPKASERLMLEASKEPGSKISTHLPTSSTAAVTLMVGLIHSSTAKAKDPEHLGSKFAIAVGGGWIAANALLGLFYHPYLDAWNEVKVMPDDSTGKKIAKERIAEEAFKRSARVGRFLNYSSFASNFAASGYMVFKADRETLSFPLSIVSVFASFTPLFFNHRWDQVWDEQYQYKKKIYGPVARIEVVPFITNQKGKTQVSPALGFSYFF
jgi:hypothetical protein